jgi:hypothetical protein
LERCEKRIKVLNTIVDHVARMPRR